MARKKPSPTRRKYEQVFAPQLFLFDSPKEIESVLNWLIKAGGAIVQSVRTRTKKELRKCTTCGKFTSVRNWEQGRCPKCNTFQVYPE